MRYFQVFDLCGFDTDKFDSDPPVEKGCPHFGQELADGEHSFSQAGQVIRFIDLFPQKRNLVIGFRFARH